jgi:hypothetical protein
MAGTDHLAHRQPGHELADRFVSRPWLSTVTR